MSKDRLLQIARNELCSSGTGYTVTIFASPSIGAPMKLFVFNTTSICPALRQLTKNRGQRLAAATCEPRGRQAYASTGGHEQTRLRSP